MLSYPMYVCNAKIAKKQTRYATHITASSKQQNWYRSDIGVLEIESTSKKVHEGYILKKKWYQAARKIKSRKVNSIAGGINRIN